MAKRQVLSVGYGGRGHGLSKWLVNIYIFGIPVVLAIVLFPFRLIYEHVTGRS